MQVEGYPLDQYQMSITKSFRTILRLHMLSAVVNAVRASSSLTGQLRSAKPVAS